MLKVKLFLSEIVHFQLKRIVHLYIIFQVISKVNLTFSL